MTWFDHDGRPTAVDLTHPVEALEPEGGEAQERVMSGEQFRQLVMRIAETFSTGDPKITVVAWRIVAGDNWESIRACARRVGCTAQAVSRRFGIIRQEFGVGPSPRQQRRLARWEAGERFKRKRQEIFQPPAVASDDQSKTNTFAQLKGVRL